MHAIMYSVVPRRRQVAAFFTVFAAWAIPLNAGEVAEDVCDDVVALQKSMEKQEFSAMETDKMEEGTMEDNTAEHKGAKPSSSAVYPYDLMTCPEAPPLTTEQMGKDDYDKIISDFEEEFDKLDRKCEGMTCTIADVAGCILRMAGHDFMDYKEGVGGGSDACTDMAEGDNAGLKDCLVLGSEGATIQSVYVKHCAKVSLADFVVIAAEAAMIYTRQIYLNATSADRGALDFKSQFRFGRTTSKTCANNQHLPDPTKSCRDVERVFVKNMGMSWKYAAALMGVHTLGRASTNNSGFSGWWSDAEHSRMFNNNFYVSLYAKGWQPEYIKETKRWQWGLSDANRDDVKNGKQMMLDSDFCLAWSDMWGPAGYKEITAADTKKTCAWTIPNISHVPLHAAMDNYNGRKFCGIKLEPHMRELPGGKNRKDRTEQWRNWRAKYNTSPGRVFTEMRAACCNGCKNFNGACRKLNEASGFAQVTKDTGVVTHPTGRAAQHVMDFANNEEYWMESFLFAWYRATSNGFRAQLKHLAESATPDTASSTSSSGSEGYDYDPNFWTEDAE